MAATAARTQYLLIKEYTLNHNDKVPINLGLFLNYGVLGSLGSPAGNERIGSGNNASKQTGIHEWQPEVVNLRIKCPPQGARRRSKAAHKACFNFRHP